MKAGAAAVNADGHDREQRDEHRRSEPVDPLRAAILGDAMAEDDIEHEERAVREGEDEAERLTGEAHIGQEPDSRHRERERDDIAPRARADGGQGNRAEELQRANGAQRQARDGEIEAGVHRAEDDP